MGNDNMTYDEFVKCLTDEQRAELQLALDEYKANQKRLKKTGYERVKKNDVYYYSMTTLNAGQIAGSTIETNQLYDIGLYSVADYYNDKTVAENNIRADKLLRRLRRFAVLNRQNKLDWNDDNADKYYIAYNYNDDGLFCWHTWSNREFGGIYFDSEEIAKDAIELFKDELTWYFKEYKDSL